MIIIIVIKFICNGHFDWLESMLYDSIKIELHVKLSHHLPLYVVHFEITRKVMCGEFNEFFMRGTLGSTQYHKTVRKTVKHWITVSKINEILISHLWSVTLIIVNPFAHELPVTAHADPCPFYCLWHHQF